MSLFENIRLGWPKATDRQVYEAADEARINELLIKACQYTNGFDTIIEQSKLSGGQRQLIALARAFLKNRDPNTRILVFDEATSALDNESEEFIRKSMDRLKNSSKIVIVIAHRLSTVKHADLIVEMQNGKIVNSGTHDYMIDKSLLYNKMVNNASESSIPIDEENLNVPKDIEKIEIDENLELNAIKIVESEQKKSSICSRIWKLNKPERFWIICSAIAYFIQGSLYPFIAFCFTEMVRLFIYYNDDIPMKTTQSYILSSIIAALTIVTFFAVFFQYYATNKASGQLNSSVKMLLFESLLKNHELKWFEQSESNSKSSLVYNINSKSPILKGYIIDRLCLTMNSISGLGIPFCLCMYFSWQLTLVISSFIPVALLWGFMQGQLFRGQANRATNKNTLEEAIKLSDDTIRNIQTLNSLNLHAYFADKLEFLFSANFKRTIYIVFLEGFFYSLGYVLYFFCQCATFSYGVYLLENNQIETHNIIRVFVSLLCSSTFVAKNISLIPDMPKATEAAKWVLGVIDSASKQKNCNLMKNFDLNGPIIFKNVGFSYKRGETALKNVDFNFASKNSAALVGQSGCGKSTVVSLILGYYKPTKGQILVNGIDFNEIDLIWFRSRIGLVSQEPVLFSGTIKENISYGLNDEKINMQDVINAAKEANVHDFIMTLPQVRVFYKNFIS